MDIHERQRVFGSGPKGMIVSSILIILVYYIDILFFGPVIPISDSLAMGFLLLMILITFVIFYLSLTSLPTKKRGNKLVTHGVYKYLSHPVYAAMQDFAIPGIAIFLKSYLLVILWIPLFLVWGWAVKSEEEFMYKRFGNVYRQYLKGTKRFIPRVY